jgi:hypothetical protein
VFERQAAEGIGRFATVLAQREQGAIMLMPIGNFLQVQLGQPWSRLGKHSLQLLQTCCARCKAWGGVLPQETGDQGPEVDSEDVRLATLVNLEAPQDKAELFELTQPSLGNLLADFQPRDDLGDDEFFAAQVQASFGFI